MLRIVFLCSGGGGNLRFVAEAIRLGLIVDAEICGLIADRECPASLFARQNNIPVSECDFSEKDQPSVMTRLLDLDPGIIVSNVHKILSSVVVNAFRGKLINLHYSLLPAFGGVIGAKALSQALDYGVQIVGTTVHLVDDRVDAGSPVAQTAIPVIQRDEMPALMDIVFRAGCISLLTGIQLIREDSQIALRDPRSLLDLSGRSVLFNPPVASFQEFHDESFWRLFK
jgi:phosphoribosylglycinamide formyltransferase 1